MRVGLDDEPELKIARFMKGLPPSIARMVKSQSYLTFDDVCHLAIKIEIKGTFKPQLLKTPLLALKLKPYPHK